MITVKPTGDVSIRLHGGGQEIRRDFRNLVLDAGWESLRARHDEPEGAMVPRWLWFGTGDEEPKHDDPGLLSRESTGKEAISVEYGGLVDAGNLTAYSEAVVRFDYDPGELTGLWSEVGLSYDDGYAEPYNRALIVDENRVHTPLLVPEWMGATVYVRLRLYLTGWGRVFDLDGYEGTLAMNNGNVQSPENNVWLKGFPIQDAVMGGVTSQREGYDPSVPTAKQYWSISQTGDWSASYIGFRARSGTEQMRLSLTPNVEKPDGLGLHFRIRVSIERG